jgi:hypothetical protein
VSRRSPAGRVDLASLISLPGTLSSSLNGSSRLEDAFVFPCAETLEALKNKSGSAMRAIAGKRFMTLRFIL